MSIGYIGSRDSVYSDEEYIRQEKKTNPLESLEEDFIFTPRPQEDKCRSRSFSIGSFELPRQVQKIVKPLLGYLRRNSLNVNDNKSLALEMQTAVFDRDILTITDLINKKADINTQDENQQTALLVACEYYPDAVRWLIQNKANVNSKNLKGNTPLIVTSIGGHLKAVHLLINNKASLDHENNAGNTALFLATANKKEEIINLLLEKKASLNHQNKAGENLLILAIYKNLLFLVEYLVDKKVDVNAKDKNEMTPLMVAAKLGNLDMVKLLVEKGKVKKNLVNNEGKTAFDLAFENGHLAISRYLN